MSTVVNKINEMLKEKRMSARELARRSEIANTTMNRYLTTDTEIPVGKLESIAKALGVTPGYLMGYGIEDDYANKLIGVIKPISKQKLPLCGNVACGEPIFADEQHESYIEAGNNMDADFCLVAKGDSMINARIFDGDLLFVKSQSTVDNGDIAVVLIDDEATVKRVYIEYNSDNTVSMVTLIPENPMYKPMRYMGHTLDSVRILGKVVAGQYRMR